MPEWITTQEAAELSGFHPEYVRRLAHQGKIGTEKKGRDWWGDRDVLHAYLQTVQDLGPQKYDPRGPVMPGEISKQELEAKDSQPFVGRIAVLAQGVIQGKRIPGAASQDLLHVALPGLLAGCHEGIGW